MKVMEVLKESGIEPDVGGTPEGPNLPTASQYDPTMMTHSFACCMRAYQELDDGKLNIPSETQCIPCEESLNAFSSDTNPKICVNKPNYDNWVGLKSKVRCIHVDTMANKTFLKSTMSSHLTESRQSNAMIQVANKNYMCADMEGNLPCLIFDVNTNKSNKHPRVQSFTLSGMTVPELSRELMSVDDLYAAGFSIDLKHP